MQIEIVTKQCQVCRKSSVMTVDSDAYNRWKDGMLVQKAFPDMPAPEREMLITGTHPECWTKMFSSEEDEN